MGACAAPPYAVLAFIAGALVGCAVRNNPYATAPSNATSTIAAVFCVVFIVRSYPRSILVRRETIRARSVASLSQSALWFGSANILVQISQDVFRLAGPMKKWNIT